MVPFLHAHRIAVRAAGVIQPGSVVHPNRLRPERAAVYPLAYRVAPPPWVGVFGKRAPVRPDDAPFLVELIQDEHLVRSMNDLARSEIMKNDSRKPLGIADVHGIIHKGGGNG